MTCIVGLRDSESKTVYIGGDSCGSNEETHGIVKSPKVFSRKDSCGRLFIIGFTSTFRIGQVLQYLTPIAVWDPAEESLRSFMVTKFMEDFREACRKAGCLTIENGEETGGTFLIATGEYLFRVEDNFSVIDPHDDYTSVGCGYREAIASMYTTQYIPMSSSLRVEFALQASAYVQNRVYPPYLILQTSADI